jgi:hypothetical protein
MEKPITHIASQICGACLKRVMEKTIIPIASQILSTLIFKKSTYNLRFALQGIFIPCVYIELLIEYCI